MKKSIALLVIVVVTALIVGCGETHPINNVEFVGIPGKETNGRYNAVFKDDQGTLQTYYLFGGDGEQNLLEKGAKYNLSVTIGDTWDDPNCVLDIHKIN